MPNVAFAGDERVVTIVKKSGSAASNWATTDATAPSTGDAVLVNAPVNPERQQDKVLDESIGSETMQSDPVNGGVRTEFEISQDLRYAGGASHLPLVLALGTSGGAPSSPNSATGATTRDQVFTPAVNINGLVATVCEGPTSSRTSDQPSASIVPSAMCHGWTLSGEGAGIVNLTSRWYGIDVFLKPAPSDDPIPSGLTLNASESSIAAATLDADGTSERIRMGDLQCYIDVESGADDFAGGSGSNYIVEIGQFELNFDRDMSWPDFGSQVANAVDSASRPQMPVNGRGLVRPSGTFQLLRYDSDLWKGRHFTNKALRMRLEFTGSEIETGYNYRFRVDLPSIRLTASPREVGGNTRSTISFDCYEAASTPTGFSSTDYVRLDLRNEQTSDIAA